MESNSYMESGSTGSTTVNVGDGERIASVAGGILLCAMGLGKAVRLNPLGILGVAAGIYLVRRGATGNCAVYSRLGKESTEVSTGPLVIEETMLVHKSKKEVFNAWRNLENLPRFMKHLKTVSELDNKRSHWEALIPGGMGATIQWDAEITHEREGEFLAWRSVWDASVDNAGEVSFTETEGGTIVQAKISYRPPAGGIGATIAKMLNEKFEDMIRTDLKGFKHMVEGMHKPSGNGHGTHKTVKQTL